VVLGEEGLGVAEEEDVITLDTVDLAPGVHDPAVVAGNDSDDIDALALQVAELLDVGRQVVGLATGRERTGNADEDNLLAGPLLAGVVLLGTAAGGGVSVSDGCPSVKCVSSVIREELRRAVSPDDIW
jgi:hypothetical protein